MPLGYPPQVFSHGPSHFASICSQKMETSQNIMKACSREKQTPSLLETDDDNPCTQPEMDHYLEQHLQPMGVKRGMLLLVERRAELNLLPKLGA
jgi:hypothetical protein